MAHFAMHPNVFTNDMLSIVSDNIEIYNYADDNTVICSGYEYEDVKAELMLNVDKIIEWFQDNHIKVFLINLNVLFLARL